MACNNILISPSLNSCLKKCKIPERKKKVKSVYTKVIKKFIKNKNVPLWYKELSERQMTSANELLNNLRDDTQQETTHRTKQNLQLLGICPLPTTSQIKVVMQYSQGNDLAFLWFLLELYYSKDGNVMSPDNNTYDTNQQILMSSIVHLDMCPTLRELDRILPKQNDKQKLLNVIKVPRKKKIHYSLPYLEPLPVPMSKKRTLTKIKEPLPSFDPYAMYMDLNYVSPNEINRWYADSEQLCNLFDNCDETNITKDERKSMCKGGINELMCAQHDDIEEFRKSLTYKLKMAVKNRCERFLQSHDRSVDQRNKFIQQLENDIKSIEEQFDKLSERFQTRTWLPQLINELLNQTIDMKDVSLCNKILSCAMDPELFGDFVKNDKRKSEISGKTIFDYGHHGKLKANEKYFKAPNLKLPYTFDYARIFSHRDPETAENVSSKFECIKHAIEQAFEFKKYDNEDDAILGCLAEMWDYELQKNQNYNDINEDYGENENDEETVISLKELKASLVNKKIDPNNDELMNNFLIACIREIKKNPKFVMIQLPQVHKLQILQLWIRTRYGYVITQRLKENALRVSKQIVEEMRRLKIKIPLPKNHQICNSNAFSFLYKNSITSKAHILMHSYFNKLKSRLLQDTQIYWYCMEPTHCISGPPREVFYSYLPAKPQDVLPFRPD